jgi:hypothetical protein
MVATLAIIAAIFLCFGFFAARTDSFRTWTQEYLSKKTGLDVTVGNIRIGWLYSLVLRDVKTFATKDEGGAGIWVDEARVALAWPLTLKLRLTGCRLRLVRMEDGNWLPAFFGRLGEIGDPCDIGWLTESFRKKGSLEMLRSSIQWSDSDGSPLAAVEGLDFSMEPVVLKNGRRLYHCQLTTDDMLRGDGNRVQDVRREWLFTESNEMIELQNEEGTRPARHKDGKPARTGE